MPVLSPRHERESFDRAFTKQIIEPDIERIIQGYADTAERMKAGGMDGAEIECCAPLMAQSVSPPTNDLDARFGGDLNSRMRVPMTVLKTCRAQVWCRSPAAEVRSGRRTTAGRRHLERRDRDRAAVQDLGQVRFPNGIRSHTATNAALNDVTPVQAIPSAEHLQYGHWQESRRPPAPPCRARAQCGNATPRHCAVDRITITRAPLTEPHLLRKIVRKTKDRIRPSVGAHFCRDGVYQGGLAYCLHNATSGREHTLSHDISRAHDK